MPMYLLHHQHEPHECAAAFAAWEGFASPLRHGHVDSSCLTGDHRLLWRVSAADADAALALLPRFVAARTTPVAVRDVVVP
ncbi:MAG TPA: hypothetical protein VKB25_12265 [Conexibacter sp.]|nr:hypothetical protein [Conexibacter sp.]